MLGLANLADHTISVDSTIGFPTSVLVAVHECLHALEPTWTEKKVDAYAVAITKVIEIVNDLQKGDAK